MFFVVLRRLTFNLFFTRSGRWCPKAL